MTIRPRLSITGVFILFSALASSHLMADSGGFNLELGPYAKIARAENIITGEVAETEPRTDIKVKSTLKGDIGKAVISLGNSPRDLEQKQHVFIKGQMVLIYLVSDRGALSILQEGFGVQKADEINVKAVQTGVALLNSSGKGEILTKMLTGSAPETAIALDFLLLEGVSNVDKISATPGLIENLEKLCRSTEWTVRRDAARALGKLGDEHSLDSLLNLVADPSNAVAQTANDSVRFITKVSTISLPPGATEKDKQAVVLKWKKLLSK